MMIWGAWWWQQGRGDAFLFNIACLLIVPSSSETLTVPKAISGFTASSGMATTQSPIVFASECSAYVT